MNWLLVVELSFVVSHVIPWLGIARKCRLSCREASDSGSVFRERLASQGCLVSWKFSVVQGLRSCWHLHPLLMVLLLDFVTVSCIERNNSGQRLTICNNDDIDSHAHNDRYRKTLITDSRSRMWGEDGWGRLMSFSNYFYMCHENLAVLLDFHRRIFSSATPLISKISFLLAN